MSKNSRAKKGGSSRAARERNSALTLDDAVSVVSERSLNSDKEDSDVPQEIEEMKVEDLLESMGEKRASTRVAAFQNFNKQLKSRFLKEFIEQNSETITTRIMNSIKKGATDELAAACQTLSLFAVVLGTAAEPNCKEFAEVLQTLIRDKSKPAPQRAAAASTLGFIYFVSVGDPYEIEQQLSFFSEVFGEKSPNNEELIAAALLSWGLLATSISSSRLAAVTYFEKMPRLVLLLENESLDVRAAAGENIALLVSAKHEYDASVQSDEPDPSAAVSEKKAFIDLNDLLARLDDMATEGSKHKAKKERKQQRHIFRDILATVEDNTLPSEKITIGTHRQEFSGWFQLKRLNALREVLDTGLQHHFLKNEVLSDIFSLPFTPSLEEDSRDKAMRKSDIIHLSKLKERAQYERDTKQRKKKQTQAMGDDGFDD